MVSSTLRPTLTRPRLGALATDRPGKLVGKLLMAAPNASIVAAKIAPLSNAIWNATANT